MFLTSTTLRQRRACHEQIQAFELVFGPEGLDLSDPSRDSEIIEKAISAELDLNWAAQNLLTPPAQKAHSEAIASAQKAYDEAIAPAQKAYSKAIAPALLMGLRSGKSW